MNAEEINKRISILYEDLKKAESMFLPLQDQLNPKVTVKYKGIEELEDKNLYPLDYQLFTPLLGALTLGSSYK